MNVENKDRTGPDRRQEPNRGVPDKTGQDRKNRKY